MFTQSSVLNTIKSGDFALKIIISGNLGSRVPIGKYYFVLLQLPSFCQSFHSSTEVRSVSPLVIAVALAGSVSFLTTCEETLTLYGTPIPGRYKPFIDPFYPGVGHPYKKFPDNRNLVPNKPQVSISVVRSSRGYSGSTALGCSSTGPPGHD